MSSPPEKQDYFHSMPKGVYPQTSADLSGDIAPPQG